jgi:hypothetical protein
MRNVSVLSFTFIFLLTLVVSPAFAVTRSGSDRLMAGSNAAEKKEEVKDASMARLQARAAKEVTRRIESLNKLILRISEFKKLSTTQKTSLTTQVQAEIDKLTALQIKIQADADLTTLKTDVQSIVTDYRIFALFMPKVQILGAADRLFTTADEMSSHAAMLETKINEQQTKGNDVSALQTLLTDMKAKVADAKTQGQSAIDTVSPLTPEGFPDNKTQLQSARQMIETGIKDLNTARQDARKITVGLLKFGKMTSEKPTKTPEPTETP